MLLMQTDNGTRPHLQTNKTRSVLKQGLLETVGKLLRKTAAKLVINVACAWCKPLLWQPSSRHAHLAQIDS
jgi:hypothetical protein